MKRNPGKLSWKCQDCKATLSTVKRKQRSSRCVACWNVWRNERRKKKWSTNNRSALHSSLISRYGITLEQYEELHRNAAGVCVLCQRVEVELVVDHCHKTGRVRGLICRQCNLMLGFALDNPETLLAGARYLKETL